MAISKKDLHDLIERLPEPEQKTAFDFLQYQVERSGKKPEIWKEIDMQKPDDEPLTEEEFRQLNSDAGYVAGEDGKREHGLQGGTSRNGYFCTLSVLYIVKRLRTSNLTAILSKLTIPQSYVRKPSITASE
ncbi:hypothetical protein [Alicyclobacillus sp. SO9]|uniref:hypothetical protein n=1 Tax=Alicyclobacillus sp. SO9 TaxID=2665646 RepID=UPI001E440806|nr:hypothetical protein [Alicyclobacillus sp. SO9]